MKTIIKIMIFAVLFTACHSTKGLKPGRYTYKSQSACFINYKTCKK